MKYILIIVFNSLLFTCKAQEINTLNKEQYDVISAFVNQNFDFEEHFYLDRNVLQKKFSISFSENYKRIIDFHHKADSICNISKDTLQLKLFCPAAFNRKKYVGLFDNDDLKYFEATYRIDKVSGFSIDYNKISKSVSIILEHTDEYYEQGKTINQNQWKKKNSQFDELPTLQIQGIYFSKDKNIIIIDYLMITKTHEKKVHFGILQKEKGVWWRLLGDISSR